MVRKLKYNKYRAKQLLYKKHTSKNRKKHIFYFKKRQKVLFTKFYRRLLKKPIKNTELLKYPFIIKYLRQLKS
jgi:hypothetical protein